GEGPAPVEQQNGVRPAGDAILLQPILGDRHKVDPIRCAEEITVRLHQTTGIDPGDSVKRFPKGRGIPLYLRLKARLAALQTDRRYAFMFDLGIAVRDNLGALLGRLFRVPANGKPLAILDLVSIPSEALNVV